MLRLAFPPIPKHISASNLKLTIEVTGAQLIEAEVLVASMLTLDTLDVIEDV